MGYMWHYTKALAPSCRVEFDDRCCRLTLSMWGDRVGVLIRAISVRRLVRLAAHVAAWIPFLISAVSSWLGDWRVVGDGAMIALGSWATFTHLPLVGLPNEFPGSPHDLGPAEYWLLAIPVHADPARGVLWGAALLCMIAASLAIEAA